jgi:hypothetical protein
MFALVSGSSPQRIDSKFVAGCESRADLKYLPSMLSVECSIKFGVRVRPVRMVCIKIPERLT